MCGGQDPSVKQGEDATPEAAWESVVVSREVVCCQGFRHRAVNLAPGVLCSTCNTLLREDGGGDGLYVSQNMLLLLADSPAWQGACCALSI